jgi:hypothetical protein
MQIIFEIYFFDKLVILISLSIALQFVRVQCFENNYKMSCLVNVMQVKMNNELVNQTAILFII